MDLQTPEPEFGCRTPDSQTPEPGSLDSGPPPTLLANRAMSGLRTLYSVFCHGGFERHRVRGAAGRGVSAPADVGAVSIRHAARRRGSSSQGAAGCPRRSRHRARGGSHRRTAAAAPPIGRRACGSAAGRATVPARHTQTQQQGVGGAAYAWRRYAFRVRARLAALSPARPRRLEPGPSEHDSTERAALRPVSSGAATKAFGWLEAFGSRFPRSYAQGRQPGCCAHTRSHSFLVRHIRNDVSCVDRSALSHTSGCQTMSPLRVLFLK